MNMKASLKILLFSCLVYTADSCMQENSMQPTSLPSINVSVDTVRTGTIIKTVNFQGTTVYLKKNEILAPISGYITEMNAQFGAAVTEKEVLFRIRTRESTILENDSSMNNNMGSVAVLSSTEGIINALNVNGTGVYVVEGNPLCSIVENKDFVVRLNVPYVYHNLVRKDMACKIHLPDNTSIDGIIEDILPTVESADQTQQVLVKPQTPRLLPENLNVTVQLTDRIHEQSLLVPKSAVMANETQDEFWVMKIMHDTLAIQIPVEKGIEQDNTVEVRSSELNINDMIISEGAYGLPDSSIVKISY